MGQDHVGAAGQGTALGGGGTLRKHIFKMMLIHYEMQCASAHHLPVVVVPAQPQQPGEREHPLLLQHLEGREGGGGRRRRWDQSIMLLDISIYSRSFFGLRGRVWALLRLPHVQPPPPPFSVPFLPPPPPFFTTLFFSLPPAFPSCCLFFFGKLTVASH